MEKKMRIFAFELRDMAVKGKSLKEMRKRKVEMLKELYRMLVLNLGQSPATFEWRITDKNDSLLPVKTYTPQSFYQEVVGINLDDYAVIGNCPSQPYGKNYRIKLGRGQLEGMDWTFLNMEMGVLKDLAYKTLLDTIPVQLSVDMGQQVDSKVGYMVDGLFDYESLYNLKFGFDKVGWVLTRDSAPNHSMVIVGMDTLNGKPTKWKIENSWGTDRGKDGFFLMSDDWFDKFGYAVVIHKKYIPEDILKLLETTPEELPFWDPLARTISVGGWGE
jgi:bleomycin hydrolase